MCKMFNTRFLKVIALLLVAIMLLNVYAIAATPNLHGNETHTILDAKVSENLKEAIHFAAENETLPIWIWMDSIDSAVINALVLRETGMDPDIYENDTMFERLKMAKIEEQVCVDNDIEIDEGGKFKTKKVFQLAMHKALSEEYNLYWSEKRNIIRREQSERTSKFIKTNIPSERKVFYQGKYTANVAVEATAEEIARLSRLPEVVEMSLYINYELEPELDIAGEQIGVYCPGGTGYDTLDGSWVGCTGAGVKIGIIEAGCGQYDSSAPQLVNKTNLHVINTYDSNGTISGVLSDHATMVTTILAGKTVLYDGRIIKGIVPGATVYEVPSNSMESALNGFDLLVAEGVSVINCSFGVKYSGDTYNDWDRAFDNAIATSGVVLVKSAGNNGTFDDCITTPGKAVNAITVGNAKTKTNSTTAAMSPFLMAPSSSFVEASYLPNKPDIVAPGSYISAKIHPNTITTDSGTSYAAPMVTGVIAQMMEYSPNMIGHPTRIKACLLLSADRTKISTTNNAVVGNQLREKSGAGFVNAISAVRYYLNETTSITTSVTTGTSTVANVYCEEGQTLRAIMVYDKQNDVNITGATTFDDYDLWLDAHNGIIVDSWSRHNNVEIIEFYAYETGYYNLNINRYRVVNSNKVPVITVTYLVEDQKM